MKTKQLDNKVQASNLEKISCPNNKRKNKKTIQKSNNLQESLKKDNEGQYSFSKIIIFIILILNFIIVGAAIVYMMQNKDPTPLSYIGCADSMTMGGAYIYYYKKAQSENRKWAAKQILDEMKKDDYTFEQSEEILKIICDSNV